MLAAIERTKPGDPENTARNVARRLGDHDLTTPEFRRRRRQVGRAGHVRARHYRDGPTLLGIEPIRPGRARPDEVRIGLLGQFAGGAFGRLVDGAVVS